MKEATNGAGHLTWPHHRLPSLGKLRDGALLLASTAYAGGYLVWSTVALRAQVGALPVADSQYLVAGIPVVALGIVILYAATGIRAVSLLWLPLVRRLGDWIRPLYFAGILELLGTALAALAMFYPQGGVLRVQSSGDGPILFVRLATLWCSYGLLLGYSEIVQTTDVYRSIGRWQQPVGRFGTIVSAVAAHTLRRLLRWSPAASKVLATVVMPALLLISGWSTYASWYFPRLPQEMGGAKPKLARLDVSRSALAEQTATTLGWSKEARPSATFETTKLAVIFMSKETLIVIPIAIPRYPHPIVLAREDIHAIEWLGGRHLDAPASGPWPASHSSGNRRD